VTTGMSATSEEDGRNASGPTGGGEEKARAAAPPRNSPGMLRDVGRQLGWHNRTAHVNDRLEMQLRGLDTFEWHFERDVPIGSVPIPIILFGPVGVFLLQASRGYWTDEDIALMDRAARTLASVLSGYPDPVRPAIVVLGGPAEERQYFTGDGAGPCWMLSDTQLTSWLLRWQDHGFSGGDIALLRDEADTDRIRENTRRFVPRGVG